MQWRRRVLRGLLYAAGLCAAVLATIVLVFAIQARARLADLEPWHRIALDEEFHADRPGAPKTFAEYRALEDRLFAEVRRKVLDDPGAADTQRLGRYTPGSIPSQLALDTPYNRSFELVPQEIRGAALLVHGLSDSPYSMRALAETLYAQGYYVLALRLPGHGTVPAGLVDVSWRDWYAAVALAAQYAAAQAPGKPFIAGGHSTGAALVTLYSVRALDDPTLPRPQALYLVSAAIGISPFAVLTNVLSGLAFIPAFEKSRWLDVLPEYDPYKYNSFPVNAANQIYTVTRTLRSELDEARARKRLDAMPRVVLFQSVVDSTVTAGEVVRGLLSYLPPRGHELVVFDVNRYEQLEALIAPGPLVALERLRAAPDLAFKITVIRNRDSSTRAVGAFVREAGQNEVTERDLPYEWPRGILSVGHVALPFPVDDPVYGLEGPSEGAAAKFNLGTFPARGENGALVVPLAQFARVRSNPFFAVIRAKVRETLPDGAESAAAPAP
ncbi:MAG TPA: alpha/beta fold hydrolase [Gammaproteobacteria bacterium]|nr:alpha/beta fold hydrolase [Gammaproteobacteria bacterium]